MYIADSVSLLPVLETMRHQPQDAAEGTFTSRYSSANVPEMSGFVPVPELFPATVARVCACFVLGFARAAQRARVFALPVTCRP